MIFYRKITASRFCRTLPDKTKKYSSIYRTKRFCPVERGKWFNALELKGKVPDKTVLSAGQRTQTMPDMAGDPL